MKKVIQTALIFCTLYSIITLISSILQLIQGIEFDDNIHILTRGAFTLIGTLSLQMIRFIKVKNAVITILISYVISIALVFLYTWVEGLFVELAGSAYRDVFFNFTGIYFVVLIIVRTFELVQNRKILSHKK